MIAFVWDYVVLIVAGVVVILGVGTHQGHKRWRRIRDQRDLRVRQAAGELAAIYHEKSYAGQDEPSLALTCGHPTCVTDVETELDAALVKAGCDNVCAHALRHHGENGELSWRVPPRYVPHVLKALPPHVGRCGHFNTS